MQSIKALEKIKQLSRKAFSISTDTENGKSKDIDYLAQHKLKKIGAALKDSKINAEEKSILVLQTNLKHLIEQKETAISQFMTIKEPNYYEHCMLLSPLIHRQSACVANIKDVMAKHFLPSQTVPNPSTFEEIRKALNSGEDDSDDMNDVDEFEAKVKIPVAGPRIFRGIKNKFQCATPQQITSDNWNPPAINSLAISQQFVN